MTSLVVRLSEQELAYLIEALDGLLEASEVRGNRYWQSRARNDMMALRGRLDKCLDEFE